MTIKTRKAPAWGAEVLTQGLRDLSSPGDARSMLGGVMAGQAAQPIPVYTIGLTDLAAEAPLERVHQTGWRYLIYGPDTVSIADLTDDGAGGGASPEPQFGGLYVGERAKRLNLALTYAEENYQAQKAVYEVRILEAPALYTAAIWLAGSHSVFIPFLLSGKLCEIESVGEEQFLSDLKQKAKTQLEFLRRDGEGSPSPG
jgi:hypothetical protein